LGDDQRQRDDAPNDTRPRYRIEAHASARVIPRQQARSRVAVAGPRATTAGPRPTQHCATRRHIELKQRGVLAADISEQYAADTIYALAADVSPYLRLSRDCGWTDTRYADLIARTLQATVGAR
jgi:hypothetical protein